MRSYQVVQQLRLTSSRLEKERILEEAWNAGCTDFFVFVNLCYNGLISFGIKQIPMQTSTNVVDKPELSEIVLELFDKLSNRQLTGHAARDAVLECANKLSVNEWNLFYKPVLQKDLDAGITDSTINKVLKKIGGDALKYTIKEFPYQRCCLPKDTKLNEFSWKDGVLSQKKADGMFINVILDNFGQVELLSRSGKPFPLEPFEDLINDIKQHFKQSTHTHGEFLVFRNGRELPRELGNGILNSVAQGGTFDNGDMPIYVAWDQIPATSAISKGACNTPYKDRLLSLTNQISNITSNNIKIVETRIVHNLEEAMEHYKELINVGFEGTIIKEPTAIWKDGTSKFAVKLKVDVDCDLEIVGFNPGNGKNEKTFGSILCKSSDGLLEVNVSGFKDDQRLKIWENKDILVGTIITVKSNCLMKPSDTNGLYSMFLPRFCEFRRDKTEADSLQKIKDQFDSAIKK